MTINENEVISRVFLGQNYDIKSTKIISEIVSKIFPKNDYKIFNFALLDIERTICLSRYQLCDICPLNLMCKFSNGENETSYE